MEKKLEKYRILPKYNNSVTYVYSKEDIQHTIDDIIWMELNEKGRVVSEEDFEVNKVN